MSKYILSHKQTTNKFLFIEREIHDLQLKNKQLRATNHKLKGLIKELERLAMVDSLTCLPNRRSLIATLNQLQVQMDRYHCPCAILFLDINNFKYINDRWSHSIGDAVLQEFSEVVRLVLRRSDILGRLAGDEFLAILPKTEEADAQQAADRIHTTLAKYPFTSISGHYLTCSIGIAAYPSTEQRHELLITAADRAMYTAKQKFHSVVVENKQKRLGYDNF